MNPVHYKKQHLTAIEQYSISTESNESLKK